MWGRHSGCGSVDYISSFSLYWLGRWLVSNLVDGRVSVVDEAEGGYEAVGEAVGGIATTPEDAFGRTSEVDLDLIGVVD